MVDKAYRMTITIPQRVKDQMENVTEQVNWSSVAAEAFQRKVIEIRTRRAKMMTKAKIVERLKKAGEADPRGFEAGRAWGRKWAEEKALPRYLRNIAKGISEDVFEDDPDRAGRLCVKLAQEITGETTGSIGFWEDAIDDGGAGLGDTEDFARGFLAGALEVWEEVKDELEPSSEPEGGNDLIPF
jgi:hypothetical protein